ncbi:unnamed protein product [Phaedon cochleariae]|uniref:Uncharacterized protein n=1 Tax=Phaedon cochleariae TaxID=80249 RepID=A0A9P0DU76_PHACE|nr:unnamed protein product [Phaedon cochleariae]
MGKFMAVLASFAAISMNFQIFRETQDAGPGPLLSTYIFLFAFFLLLWDLTLYPKTLRQLGRISQFFMEFLIATFMTECIMIDFWFPLEKMVMNIPAKMADVIDDMLSSGEWRCDTLCDTLRSQALTYVVSYAVSVSFLVAVLHATRVIDLRALREGPSCFFGDIVFRLKKVIKKQLRMFGIGARRVEMNSDINVDLSADICESLTQRKPRRSSRKGRRQSSKSSRDKKCKDKSIARTRSRSRSSCVIVGRETEENVPFLEKLGCNII